jgi:hypothetical protein
MLVVNAGSTWNRVPILAQALRSSTSSTASGRHAGWLPGWCSPPGVGEISPTIRAYIGEKLAWLGAVLSRG